jgi:hypothetical protein
LPLSGRKKRKSTKPSKRQQRQLQPEAGAVRQAPQQQPQPQPAQRRSHDERLRVCDEKSAVLARCLFDTLFSSLISKHIDVVFDEDGRC